MDQINTFTEPAQAVEHGLIHHRKGEYLRALACYERALKIDPNHQDANNLSADVYHRLGNNLKALYHANLAVSANRIAQFLNTRGMVFIGMGKFDEALTDLKAAAKLDPKKEDVQNNLSITYRNLKQYKKAAEHAQIALTQNPAFLEAWITLGAVKQDAGDLTGALDALNSALALDDKNLIALENISKLYDQMGDCEKVDYFANRAISLECNSIEIYFSLAHSLIQLNRLSDAVNLFVLGFEKNNSLNISALEALLLQDIFFKVLYDCCQYLVTLEGRSKAALRIYDKCIESAPKVAHALWVNRGSICFHLGMIADAIRCNQEAIKCNPEQIWAYNNLGVCYIQQEDSISAIQQFEKALAIQPNFAVSLGWLLKEKGHICDWSHYDELRSKVRSLEFTSNTSPIAPFTALSVFDNPKELLYWATLSAHELFDPVALNAPSTALSQKLPVNKNRKIRIGYYSYDFRNHPVAHLTARLFEVHDREQFDIYAYSYGPDDGASVRDRIKKNVTEFIDLKDMSVIDSARRIAQDEIDFLIDLTGNTLHTRSQVFALRPARIQAHWLGFVGTMGSNYYDYIIADDIVAPAGDEAFFSEKILRLESGMHIADDTRIIQASEQNRSLNGLPQDGVVFGCFSQTFKIQPEIFSYWMKILLAVPNSILWLASGPKGSIENLKASAQKFGVDPNRLIVAQRCEMGQYLSRFSQMDLYLDASPYSSGTVASDALFSGCPVLTLSGNTMVSRMAGSIVAHAGLPELIAYDPNSYIEKAIEISQKSGRIEELRTKISQKKADKLLFNAHTAVKNLENKIKDML